MEPESWEISSQWWLQTQEKNWKDAIAPKKLYTPHGGAEQWRISHIFWKFTSGMTLFIIYKIWKSILVYLVKYSYENRVNHDSTSSESVNQMESWLFLDFMVRKSSVIEELLSSVTKFLLNWMDAYFFLDHSFDSFNWVRRVNIKADGCSEVGFHKMQHLTSKFVYSWCGKRFKLSFKILFLIRTIKKIFYYLDKKL